MIPVAPVVIALTSPGPVATATPSVTTAPVVPAASDTGVGLLGFLIVCVLLAACAGLFFAMRGSLRRLRDHEVEGSFGGPPQDRS